MLRRICSLNRLIGVRVERRFEARLVMDASGMDGGVGCREYADVLSDARGGCHGGGIVDGWASRLERRRGVHRIEEEPRARFSGTIEPWMIGGLYPQALVPEFSLGDAGGELMGGREAATRSRDVSPHVHLDGGSASPDGY